MSDDEAEEYWRRLQLWEGSGEPEFDDFYGRDNHTDKGVAQEEEGGDGSRDRGGGLVMQPAQNVPSPCIFEVLQEEDKIHMVKGEVRAPAQEAGGVTWLSVDFGNHTFAKKSLAMFRHERSGREFKAAIGKAPSSIAGQWLVKLQAEPREQWIHFTVVKMKDQGVVTRHEKALKQKKEKEEKDKKREREKEHRPENRVTKSKQSISREQLKRALRKALEKLEAGPLGDADNENLQDLLRSYDKGDLACWTQKLDAAETFFPGQVVALVFHKDGLLRATKSPSDGAKVFTWTVVADRLGVNGGPRPLTIANPYCVPQDDESSVLVVHMGHVRVGTRDMRIVSGDFICGSPQQNGEAVRYIKTGERRRLVGVALGDASDNFVEAFVWAMRNADPRVSEVEEKVETLGTQLEAHSERLNFGLIALGEFLSKLDALETRVSALEDMLSRMFLLGQDAGLHWLQKPDFGSLAAKCQEVLLSKAHFVVDVGVDPRFYVERCQTHMRSLRGWLKRFEQQSMGTESAEFIDVLLKAIHKLEEDANSWEEVAVAENLRRELRQQYGSFRLDLFGNPNTAASRIPFQDAYIRHRLLRDENEEIDLEDIDFSGKVTKVTGSAGMGKSTWCKMLCYQWVKRDTRTQGNVKEKEEGHAFHEHWDVVVLLDGKRILSILLGSKQMAWNEFVAQLLFEGDRVKAQSFCQWLMKPDSSVLWILDAYDVLDREWEEGDKLTILLERLARNSLLVVTRPNLKQDIMWDQRFDMAPFNAFQVASFVHLYFEGVQVDLSLIPAKYDGWSLFRRLCKGSSIPFASSHSLPPLAGPSSLACDVSSPLWLVKTETERQVYEVLSENPKLSVELRAPTLLGLLCYAVWAENDGEKKPLASGLDGLARVNHFDTLFVFKVIVDSLIKRAWPGGARATGAKEARSMLGRLAWNILQNGPTIHLRYISLTQEGSLEEVEAVMLRSGLLEMVGHAEKHCYQWKYGSLQEYLAAEFLYSIQNLQEFEALCREIPPHIQANRTFVNSMGMLLRMDLQFLNSVTIKMQAVVKFLLGLKVEPSANEAGRAVVQCLLKEGALRHYAEQLWRQDVSFASPWADFVAGFGDIQLAAFMMDVIDGLENEGFLRNVACCDNLDFLRWLLDVKKCDPTKLLASMYACGNPPALKLLLEHGADPTNCFIMDDTSWDQFPFMKLTLEYHKAWSAAGMPFRWAIEDSAVLEALEVWLGHIMEDETVAIVELLVDEISERVSNSQMKLDDEKSVSILRAALTFAAEFSLHELHARLRDLLAHSNGQDVDNLG